MPPLVGKLVVEKTETAWILNLPGEHDATTADTLAAQLDAVFASGTRVLVDVTETTFLDSSTLGVLYRGHGRSQAHAEDAFVLVAPVDSPARRLFDLVAVSETIPVFDSRPDALLYLSHDDPDMGGL